MFVRLARMRTLSVRAVLSMLVLSVVFAGLVCSDEAYANEVQGKSTQKNELIDKANSQSKEKINPEDISSAQDYSDGFAKVRTTNGQYVYIDIDGNIMFDPSEKGFGSGSSITNYCNGGALAIKEDNKKLCLINTEGDILFDPDVEGQEKGQEVYGDAFESVEIEDIETDENHGYYAVCFKFDSFEMTGDSYGVLNSNAEWVVEPLPASDGLDESIDTSSYFLRICNRAEVLYRNGEVLECTEKGTAYYSTQYFNGMDWNDLVKQEDALAHHGIIPRSAPPYSDVDGNVVFDISSNEELESIRHIAIYGDPFKHSEYVLVTLTNNGGGSYITIYDIDGNMMFSPIESTTRKESFTDVAFFYRPSNEELGHYIDINGEQLGDLEFTDGHDFYCNRAWVEYEESWHCINEKGKIVF